MTQIPIETLRQLCLPLSLLAVGGYLAIGGWMLIRKSRKEQAERDQRARDAEKDWLL